MTPLTWLSPSRAPSSPATLAIPPHAPSAFETSPGIPTPAAPHTANTLPRTVDRLTWLALVGLAATAGLSDIAPVSPPNAFVLNAVHALLPLVIVLALVQYGWCSTARDRRWPHFPRALALPSALWLSVLGASAALAAHFQAEALAALARPASGLLLAWAVCNVCSTDQRWRRLTQALASGGVAVALIGIAEATRLQPVGDWIAALRNGEIPIGDVPRVAATLSHPNEAAMFLELTLPLLIAWAWTASPRWCKPLALAALATLLAIALTFSRAGLVAAAAALGVLALVAFRRRARGQLLLLGPVSLALPLALAWGSLMDPGLDHRLLASIDESSLQQPSRTEFWAAAVVMARDHPLLGVGPDNFRWLFATYSDFAVNNLGIHAHDQYLESLADTGILGFATFVWLMAALTLAAARGVRYAGSDWPWRAALLASLTAWLVHAFLDDFERFWPTSLAFWLIAGLILCRPLAARHADQ